MQKCVEWSQTLAALNDFPMQSLFGGDSNPQLQHKGISVGVSAGRHSLQCMPEGAFVVDLREMSHVNVDAAKKRKMSSLYSTTTYDSIQSNFRVHVLFTIHCSCLRCRLLITYHTNCFFTNTHIRVALVCLLHSRACRRWGETWTIWCCVLGARSVYNCRT